MPLLPLDYGAASPSSSSLLIFLTRDIASTRTTISSFIGSLSFFIWLFAQSPQIVKNYQRKSVEGLSLVFLFQWIAGDVLNLVGCLLTGQLFFQVAVATWFVFVDVVLSVQVVLYTLIRPRRSVKAHHRKHHHRRPHHKGYDTFSQVKPIDQWYYERARRPASGSRRAQSYNAHTASASTSKKVKKLDMSASADLADTLRASSTRPDRPRHSRSSSWRPQAVPPLQWSSTSASASSSSSSASASSSRSASIARHPDTAASDQHPSSPQTTVPRGRQRHSTARRPTVVLSSRSSSTSSYRQMTQEAIRVLQMVERLEESGASVSRHRGRLPRVIVADEEDGERMVTRQVYDAASSSSSAGQQPRGRRKSQKRISATATAGEGTSSTGSSTPQADLHTGHKKNPGLDADRVEEGLVSAAHDSEMTIREPQAQSRLLRRMSVWLLIVGTLVVVAFLSGFSLMRGPIIVSLLRASTTPPSASTQLLGRLSSWLCTILYVTSRLPQIWENQTRRSCEGISILLFIAAFLGNFFYAISILSNPESGQWIGRGPVDGPPLPDDPWAVGVKAVASDEEAHKYLMESMPFLIGSAGTLVFDAVVLWQWYVFGES